MNCSLVRDRLPDEDPEVLGHVRECADCRRLSDSYRQDLAHFREGLLGLAALGKPIALRAPLAPERRVFPLAAAAAMLVGILALVLLPSPSMKNPSQVPVTSVEQTDPETARRRGEALRSLADSPVRRGQVVGTAQGSGYVRLSAGKSSNVQEGDEFSICRRGVFVAKVVVVKVDDGGSEAQVAFRESDPRLGDDVFETVPIPPAERKAALDYLFSFRPVKETDRAAADAALLGLGSEDPAVRKKSLKELVLLGAPARLLLEKEVAREGKEDLKARLRGAFDRWAELEDLLGGTGVERDLEYLTAVDDPRAYERLKRILSAVRPFSKEGFPERGSGLGASLRAWWEKARGRVSWNAESDRYEERNP